MRMINYEPKDGDFVSGEAFVALARAVLATRNTGNFHDDWVQIRTDYNGHDIEITRCKQIVDDGHRKSHLGVSNPTTMVAKGEIIRHHGEHCYVTQHLRDLINPPPRNADELTGVIRNWLDGSPATEWGDFEHRLHDAIGDDGDTDEGGSILECMGGGAWSLTMPGKRWRLPDGDPRHLIHPRGLIGVTYFPTRDKAEAYRFAHRDNKNAILDWPEGQYA